MGRLGQALPEDAIVFLRELNCRGVRFLCVDGAEWGLDVRQDVIEVLFEDVRDPRIREAATAAGSACILVAGGRQGAYFDEPLGFAVEVIEPPGEEFVFALEHDYMAELDSVGDVPVRTLAVSRVGTGRGWTAATDPLTLAREVLLGRDGTLRDLMLQRPDLAEDDTAEGGPDAPARSGEEPRDVRAALTLGTRLRFSRVLPSGSRPSGIQVHVEVSPNLTIHVGHQGTALHAGVFDGDQVCWFGEPSPAMTAMARAIVAADVRDMLRVFTRGDLDARAWTSEPRALEVLGAASASF